MATGTVPVATAELIVPELVVVPAGLIDRVIEVAVGEVAMIGIRVVILVAVLFVFTFMVARRILFAAGARLRRGAPRGALPADAHASPRVPRGGRARNAPHPCARHEVAATAEVSPPPRALPSVAQPRAMSETPANNATCELRSMMSLSRQNSYALAEARRRSHRVAGKIGGDRRGPRQLPEGTEKKRFTRHLKIGAPRKRLRDELVHAFSMHASAHG